MGAVDFFAKEFRTKRMGFPDLLRYDRLYKKPGVILGKGGELMATYRYRGPDMQCSSDGELFQLRFQIAAIIKDMPSGWMLHTTTERHSSENYPEDGYFPDVVTQFIEAERKEQYRAEGGHHENDYYITFTFLPEGVLKNRMREFAFDDETRKDQTAEYLANKSLEYFEKKLSDMIGKLERNLGKMERLMPYKKYDQVAQRNVWYDEQLAYLFFCITGKKQPIRLPNKALAVGVDYVIGSHEFYTGIRPRIGKNHISVLAIESLPDSGTHFGMLEILNKLPIEFRWTTRWIARDQQKLKFQFNMLRSKWRQKIRGFIADMRGIETGPVNKDAVNMAADVEFVLEDIEANSFAYGNWTSTVILMHQNPSVLATHIQYLIKHLEPLGFVLREETVNSVEAYLGSLPGHGYENVRRPEISNMNLADILPMQSTWQGPERNPCSFIQSLYGDTPAPPLMYGASSGGTPFRVVLHNGDVGHTFVGGPTGAGKSTLLGLLAASHFRYPNAQFFGFEKGESMLALCYGAGGNHFNFMDEDPNAIKYKFAPFAQIHKQSELSWAIDYVLTILELNKYAVNPGIRSEVRRALQILATRPVKQRGFTELKGIIQIREIRNILEQYEADLADGMLNGHEDNINMSRFNVFEMEQLMSRTDIHVVPVLLYLFRMIERTLDGSPTIISLDEAWLMLQHPLFIEKIKEWLKVLRKANALVIFATQEIQDAANSPIASTIFSACQTKILLPNASANSAENLPMYRNIGVSDREIELLVHGIPKRDYLFRSTEGKRMFQLELGPIALAFIAASGKEDRSMAKALMKNYGRENWVMEWLKYKGVHA